MEVQEVKEQLKSIFRQVINNDKWITKYDKEGEPYHVNIDDTDDKEEKKSDTKDGVNWKNKDYTNVSDDELREKLYDITKRLDEKHGSFENAPYSEKEEYYFYNNMLNKGYRSKGNNPDTKDGWNKTLEELEYISRYDDLYTPDSYKIISLQTKLNKLLFDKDGNDIEFSNPKQKQELEEIKDILKDNSRTSPGDILKKANDKINQIIRQADKQSGKEDKNKYLKKGDLETDKVYKLGNLYVKPFVDDDGDLAFYDRTGAWGEGSVAQKFLKSDLKNLERAEKYDKLTDKELKFLSEKGDFEKGTKSTKKDEDRHQKVRDLEDKAYKEFKTMYDNYIDKDGMEGWGGIPASRFDKAKEQFNKKYKDAFDKLESDRFVSFEDFAKRENKQSDRKDNKYEIPKDYKDSVKSYSKEKHEQAADFYGEKMATVQKKSVAHPENEDYRKQFEEYKALKDYHEEKAKSDSKGEKKADNSKEQDMALIEELKKLITKVENTKGEKDMEIENEKVDKRDIIRQIMAIAGKEEASEDVKTIAKLAEKLAYDKSEAGTADNKCKNEDDEKEVEEEVKEDV